MFHDLHVHTSLSIGENTVEEMAETAKRIGLGSIGIARYYNGKIEQLPKIEGIDLVSCVIIKSGNAAELDKAIRNVRNKAEIIMVHGGDYDVNRAACENPMVDILCHPELGRKDSGLDHVCMKAAGENKVAIEINFREILESYKRRRIYILSAMKKNIKLAKKYETRIITTSGAVSKWGMRSGRELAAFAYLLGLELGESIATTSTVPEEIVRINREKLAGNRFEGVSVVE
ncbi:MAG: hypothetical protein HYT72_02915 [Candidatus Aenigmarchaeota archaeon]|nr:hypothetical protein [Candidatus Aenigmarchaeota archaeon]